jgi:hypothetical protein
MTESPHTVKYADLGLPCLKKMEGQSNILPALQGALLALIRHRALSLDRTAKSVCDA